MNDLSFAILLAVAVMLVARGVVRPERIYEFPVLAGVAILGFIVPQLPGLAADPYLPAGAFEKTMIVATSSALACQVGWAFRHRPPATLATFSEGRLLAAAATLSLLGAFFFFQYSRLPYEVLMTIPHTGIAVVYLFLGKLVFYGFAIALLCLVNRVSVPALLIVLFDSAFYLDRILVAGRRAETVQFAMTIALAVWFLQRRTVPRAVVLAALAVGTLGLGSIGDYRDRTLSRDGARLGDFAEIDVVGNFGALVSEGGQEMRNAITIIAATDRTGNFDFGLFHWNALVFNFVPGQFVGTRFKESLLVQVPGFRPRDYTPPTGTTETGFADAFASFWYAGAVKFLLIAAFMGFLYRGAMAGRTEHRLAYMLLIVPAMHTITHHTQWIVTEFLQAVIFVGPALLFARRGRVAAPPAALPCGRP